ncbi:MAG: glycoside hydrolase family 3 N-terminal domain-containing protein [Cyanobacteria bacterium P01_A01_bin.3]
MELTLQQQVAQMIVVRASGHLLDSQAGYPQWEWPRDRLQPLLQDVGVGGVLLFGGTVADVMLRVQQMQEWATIPLLVCADVEWGVGQRFKGATEFPPAIALSHLGPDGVEWARQMGQITAREAAALGINWLFAPVVDVQSNPANPVIDVRAFGTTPERVGALSSAFIAGAKSAAVLTTAKHFPGHGDTSVDSHLLLPEIPHDRDRLESLEWKPFKHAIDAGVDAVMSAHLMVPQIDPDWPATLSHTLLEGIVRREWQFEGLIATDAMTMGAIAQFPSPDAPLSTAELAVRAVEAGADVIVMPPQPLDAIQGICEAVESGRLSRFRIRRSVERILKAKHRVCDSSRMAQLPLERMLPGARPVVKSSDGVPTLQELLGTRSVTTQSSPKSSNLERLLETAVSSSTSTDVVTRAIGTASARQTSEAIARAAVQTSRSNALPLHPETNWVNWVWTDSWLGVDYMTPNSPAIASASERGMQTLLADLHTPIGMMQHVLEEAGGIVLHAFVRSGPFRGYGGLSPAAQQLLMEHVKSVKALICYGSRGAFDRMLAISQPYGTPCIYSGDRREVAQAEVVRQLWGTQFQAVAATPEA